MHIHRNENIVSQTYICNFCGYQWTADKKTNCPKCDALPSVPDQSIKEQDLQIQHVIANEHQQVQVLLQKKFPNLHPMGKAPSLVTINGVGGGLYGKRDYDRETNTYVSTYCFCILFIPMIAIRAFRVCKAENGGWYFIGEEPLSNFAKIWNRIALCIAGIVVIWFALPWLLR